MKFSELILCILILFVIFFFALNRIEINSIEDIIKIQQETINYIIETQDLILNKIPLQNKNYIIPQENIFDIA